jgi:hypothetical protein
LEEARGRQEEEEVSTNHLAFPYRPAYDEKLIVSQSALENDIGLI